MADLNPKKIVSIPDTEREAGRDDVYQELGDFDKMVVDDYVQKRDQVSEHLERAEEDIDIVLKRTRGKDVPPTSDGG